MLTDQPLRADGAAPKAESMLDYIKRRLTELKGMWPEVSRLSGVPYPTICKLYQGVVTPRIPTCQPLFDTLHALQGTPGYILDPDALKDQPAAQQRQQRTVDLREPGPEFQFDADPAPPNAVRAVDEKGERLIWRSVEESPRETYDRNMVVGLLQIQEKQIAIRNAAALERGKTMDDIVEATLIRIRHRALYPLVTVSELPNGRLFVVMHDGNHSGIVDEFDVTSYEDAIDRVAYIAAKSWATKDHIHDFACQVVKRFGVQGQDPAEPELAGA